ncbi:uncharacterized protein VTP21DRAFT_3658 [Calcarisporiella thermophila]|uniref:uncharacterized protein n=1 Tax=Calcarisporiella thermophila TaxID=911321 RepID=UPI0037439D04
MWETCSPGAYKWIHFLFGNCVYSNAEAASLLLGFASVLFWLNAQLPQIIRNFLHPISVNSLSPLFLLNWFAGDLSNLAGCLLTNQLPFQTFLAMYFCVVDTILLSQYLVYSETHGRREERQRMEERDIIVKVPSEDDVAGMASETTELVVRVRNYTNPPAGEGASLEPQPSGHRKLLYGILLLALPSVIPSLTTASVPGPLSLRFFSSTSSTILLPVDDFPSPRPIKSDGVGAIFAWTCTALYLTCRLPQIFHNFQRRSTQGLALAMFICAWIANLTYTLSILVHPEMRGERLWGAIPYLIGAGGSMMFDGVIFIQYWLYSTPFVDKERGGDSMQDGEEALIGNCTS